MYKYNDYGSTHRHLRYSYTKFRGKNCSCLPLFGIEGYIADKYFSALKKIYSFPGRKPQGRDKFNSVLNYGYGILYNEIERACLYVGLDPFLGLYHSERYGKPALVLDVIEEFRVPLVDSVLFPLFLNRNLEGNENFKLINLTEY